MRSLPLLFIATMFLAAVSGAQNQKAVLVRGTVVCFSDETVSGYACALIETGKGAYQAVWYPATQTSVVRGGAFEYYCAPAPTALNKPVSFRVDQYTTELGAETLNPSRDDRAQLTRSAITSGKRQKRPTAMGSRPGMSMREVHPASLPNPIGDRGSTHENHVFRAQRVAVSKTPPASNTLPPARIHLSGAQHDVVPLKRGAKSRPDKDAGVVVAVPKMDGNVRWGFSRCSAASEYIIDAISPGAVYVAVKSERYDPQEWPGWQKTAFEFAVGSLAGDGSITFRVDYLILGRRVAAGERLKTPVPKGESPVVILPM